MSNDQMYRLEASWTSSEWSLSMDEQTIQELNNVAPDGYHYALTPSDTEDRVELYEYEGEVRKNEIPVFLDDE